MNDTATAHDQMLWYVFVTALEGGVNYWSECSEYHHSFDGGHGADDLHGFYAVIRDCEDENDTVYRIDRDVVARGWELAATEWADKIRWNCDGPPPLVAEDTDWDHDAGDADVIVQLGLFGKVVYG